MLHVTRYTLLRLYTLSRLSPNQVRTRFVLWIFLASGDALCGEGLGETVECAQRPPRRCVRVDLLWHGRVACRANDATRDAAKCELTSRGEAVDVGDGDGAVRSKSVAHALREQRVARSARGDVGRRLHGDVARRAQARNNEESRANHNDWRALFRSPFYTSDEAQDENTENCRKLDFHSTDAATFAYAPDSTAVTVTIVSTKLPASVATSGQKWHAASICANSITEARNIHKTNRVRTWCGLSLDNVYSLRTQISVRCKFL